MKEKDVLPENGNMNMSIDGSSSEPATAPQALSLPLLYANPVTGQSPASPKALVDWTPVGEHDLVPSTFNGEPELKVSSVFKEKLCSPWRQTLVVRAVGLDISYITFCNRIKALWRPSGSMEIMGLGH
ncbi:unnamed protein product [Linum trigynum]|uniref:Uncharacterized protein n=1 Tax=Linum trigynum TaxID=586398 RepID=A0AAV2CZ93_9ROSI